MLNKFYLLGLVIVSTSAKAQNISGSYQPMADGQVKKQQVLSPQKMGFLGRLRELLLTHIKEEEKEYLHKERNIMVGVKYLLVQMD